MLVMIMVNILKCLYKNDLSWGLRVVILFFFMNVYVDF